MENTSGQGKLAVVPPEIDRFNWGAFLLNWIWGLGNDTYIALLMFVPFVNVVMPFVLGFKGSAWAWQNKRWESVDEFKRIQRKWAKWAVVIYLAIIVLIFTIIFSVISVLKNSEAYKMGVSMVEANAQAVEILGPPISTGMPGGSIETSGPSGMANLSFCVEGSKGKGTVYLNAEKKMGKWTITQIEMEVSGSKERINLNK